MTERWDAVVVGAGVGGLCAALDLAHEGRSVLVADRNPHPGGTAYAFHRQGFWFPMGPMGLSSPALVRETMERLGLAAPPAMRPVHYRVRAFGLDAPLSAPLDGPRKSLADQRPEDAEGVEKFFDQVERIAKAMRAPEDGASRELLTEAAAVPAGKYLEGLIKHPGLRRVLGSVGTSEPYSTLALLAGMWNLVGAEGVWRPDGGLSALVNRMVEALKKGTRAELRLAAEVREIMTESGRVEGVRIGNEEIAAPVVISNSDFRSTFLKLLDPEALPPEWLSAVFNARLTSSNLQVCIGFDPALVDLSAFQDADRIIYRRDAVPASPAPDWRALEIDPDALAGQELELALWSARDPALAPEGFASLVIRTEAEYSHFARYRPASGKRLKPYYDYKMRLAKALTREAEKVLPGLAQAIKVMDAATPLTFEERGGRSGGAVAGWSWDFEDNQDFEPRRLIRTPLGGLYMAGYQAFSSLFMGGVPTAMLSGRAAARAALDNVGPVTEVTIPGGGW
jgi:phytoene dehydrogenase-like protein